MYSVFLAKLYSIFYIKQECFIVVRATQSLVKLAKTLSGIKSPRLPVTLSGGIKQTLAQEQTDNIWENMKKNKVDKVRSKNERRYYFHGVHFQPLLTRNIYPTVN